jgi:hypothetical protein
MPVPSSGRDRQTGAVRNTHTPARTRRWTGMPGFRASEARLPQIPLPERCTTPIGIRSSIRPLRRQGPALPAQVQFGLKATWGTLRFSAHWAAIRSALFALPPCSSTMPGCFAHLVEDGPDPTEVLAVLTAGEEDPRPGRDQQLGVGLALGRQEVARRPSPPSWWRG